MTWYRGLIVLLLVPALLACGGDSKEQAPATATPRSASIARSILDLFYPEFRGSGLKINSTTTVPVLSGVPTTIANLTDQQLRSTTVLGLYNVFESYAGQPFVLPGFDGTDDSILIGPRQAQTRSFLVIPGGAVKPRATTSELIKTRNPPAVTSWDTNDNVFTFVELKEGGFVTGLFTQVREFATLNFAVEVCQQTLEATAVEPDGTPVADPIPSRDAQELVCNSLGGAVAARALGMPYEVYEAFANAHPIRLTEASADALVVSESAYAAFPVLGSVLR